MLGIRSVARESGKSGDMCKYCAFVCVCVHFTWGYMETAEVAVHLIPLLHPCGVLLIENGPEYHQWGKHPQERDQLPPPQKKRLQ